jgi:hypothetical protein
LNNKILSTKKTISLFLAFILVTGTITALSSPSFMTNASAQSESYYGMDNNNYKSQYGQDKYKTKDNVVIKKINCDNINLNVNGLELNLTSVPFLNNLLTSEAGENGERGTGSYESDNSGTSSSGQQSDSGKEFKFICINNNNNTVIVGNETTPQPPTPTPQPPTPTPISCEDCLNFLSVRYLQLITTALESETGLIVQYGVEETTLRSLGDICLLLESATTYDEIGAILAAIIFVVLPPDEADEGVILSFELLDCLAETLDIPIPPRE